MIVPKVKKFNRMWEGGGNTGQNSYLVEFGIREFWDCQIVFGVILVLECYINCCIRAMVFE